MKKTIALTLAMAAMLCGCEEMPDNVSSLALAPKATTAATAPQETTAAESSTLDTNGIRLQMKTDWFLHRRPPQHP